MTASEVTLRAHRSRPAPAVESEAPWRGHGLGRVIELVAVLLLGITTIGTAWCAYEAAQWGAESTDLAQRATDDQIEAARQFGAATQRVSYDSTIVAMYAEAKAEGKENLTQFYRRSLIRPEFLPTLNRWEAEVRAGRSPTPLTDDQDYVSAQLADYRRSVAAAQVAGRGSQDAAATASGYVATTILLAIALFFAGVTTSFRYRPAQVLILVAAFGAVAAAATRLVDLPIM